MVLIILKIGNLLIWCLNWILEIEEEKYYFIDEMENIEIAENLVNEDLWEIPGLAWFKKPGGIMIYGIENIILWFYDF